MSSIDTCLEGNGEFVERRSTRLLPGPPARRLAVVACMDARLDPVAVLGLGEGDAHVIRNAGGIVTEDVVRSLAISQRLLDTREIMLIHHTECGMMGFEDAEVSDAMKEEVGVRPPFDLGSFKDLDEDVLESIERLKKSPFLQATEAIRGFVYDVETGALREVHAPRP